MRATLPVCAIMAGIIAVLSLLLWEQQREVGELRQALLATRTSARPQSAKRPLKEEAPAMPVRLRDAKDAAAGGGAAAVPQAAEAQQSGLTAEQRAALMTTMARNQRWEVLAKYGDLLARLKLDPARWAKLKDLLVERDEAAKDARDMAERTGLAAKPRETQAAIAQATGQYEDEIKSLLGPDAYADYVAWNGARAWKASLVEGGELGGCFVEAGAPLTAEQTDLLAKTVYELNGQFENNEQTHTPDPVTGLSPAQQAVLDRVGGALTPEQRQALLTYYANANLPKQVRK